METAQFRWTRAGGWEPEAPGRLNPKAQLLLVFGGTQVLKDRPLMDELRAAYPGSHLFGCSTAGEIFGTEVSDDSLVVTAVAFDRTKFQGAKASIASGESSADAGGTLGRALPHEGLAHVLVLSDGLQVNGSELVRGLTDVLPAGVTVTGGLSADGPRFHGPPQLNTVAALGLYGPHIHVGFGSLGGWDSFGPERLITRSKGNVLYELDGKSALQLYKNYLGEHATGLPSTGLLFPLCLRTHEGEAGVVRTILSVSEEEQSMTFAGDVPVGAYARLMKANFDRLIDGAVGAAMTSYQAVGSTSPDLAMLISCVGRKLILKQRVEEEVEGVRGVLGERTALAGFYSYGEISPFAPSARCELHNQTMTITTFAES
jgi:hypothetical protein